METTRGYVYVARSEDHQLLKIGYTDSPHNRLFGMRSQAAKMLHSEPTWWHFIALFRGDMELEAALHQCFQAHRIAGAEWFTAVPEIVEFARYYSGSEPASVLREAKRISRNLLAA